jgi:hypothetical protein
LHEEFRQLFEFPSDSDGIIYFHLILLENLNLSIKITSIYLEVQNK